ncbi:Cerato-platanin-domain-containing protein [Pisolithus tinctorius]|nr:Cerato-platanin-domain-containing protein [Pisolithus tinctorius]
MTRKKRDWYKYMCGQHRPSSLMILGATSHLLPLLPVPFPRLPDLPPLGHFALFAFPLPFLLRANWNDANCGKCYGIMYAKNTINVLALDVSKDGFTVSPQAMSVLTNGQASALGRVKVTAVEVPASECGL